MRLCDFLLLTTVYFFSNFANAFQSTESCTGYSSSLTTTCGFASNFIKHQNPFEIDGEFLFGQPKAKSFGTNSGSLSCLKDMAHGVWNATGGQVELAGQIISDPQAA
jgi:hypothetical protein